MLEDNPADYLPESALPDGNADTPKTLCDRSRRSRRFPDESPLRLIPADATIGSPGRPAAAFSYLFNHDTSLPGEARRVSVLHQQG
jgi:hypothetical protein